MPPEQEVQQEQAPPSLREVIDAAAAELTDKELSTPDDASPPDDDLSSSPDQDSGVVDSDLESSQSDTDNFLDEDPDLVALDQSEQEEQVQEQPEPVDPALTGWKDEMKEFNQLPKPIQSKIIERERERNADYTRKQQGMSAAVNFAESLAPVFSDPALQQELRITNRTPQTAIAEWANFHKELSAPQYETRVGAIQRIMAAAQIDPAHLIPPSQQQGNIPALPEEELADPAINNLHRTNQALQNQLRELSMVVNQQRIDSQARQQASEQTDHQLAVQRATEELNAMKTEKGPDGKLAYPHFEKLQSVMANLYRPGVTYKELYEEASFKDPETRQALIQAEAAKSSTVERGKRAEVAKKANIKTVSKQATPAKEMNGNAPTIRDAMNAALDDLDA